MEQQASEIDNKSPTQFNIDKIRSSKSLGSYRSINLTPQREVPRTSNGRLKKQDMLFKPWIQRSEAGMQTEVNTGIASKLKLDIDRSKSNSIEQIPDADENEIGRAHV